MSETDEIPQRCVATVIAHRSPHRTRPPDMEINGINHSFKSYEPSEHGTLLSTFYKKKQPPK